MAETKKVMANKENVASNINYLFNSDHFTEKTWNMDELWHLHLGFGQNVLHKVRKMEKLRIANLSRLSKKIEQELRFLSKCERKLEILSCSNLRHLSSLVEAVDANLDVVSVLQSFNFVDGDNVNRKLCVDIVAEKGHKWVKVVARNARALDLNARGEQQFGQRSILEQVRDFRSCALQNPRMFRVAEIVFDFRSGISSKLAAKIEKKGVLVLGQRIDFDDNEDDSSDDEYDDENESIDDDLSLNEDDADISDESLNLDVTAMIAYVSALTNGHANLVFAEPILSEQASRERSFPAKPFLQKIMQNRHLVCCQSAMTDFKAIVETLGGPGERERAAELIARVEVVPDQMSERLSVLDASAKIKTRSKAIFGTGDTLRVVTLSANSGFVRAARGQGIDVAVLVHESRALTEAKMHRAKPIS